MLVYTSDEAYLKKSVSRAESAVCGSRRVWNDPLNDNVVEISVYTSDHRQPEYLGTLEDGDPSLSAR